jgi:hypothetical protein
MDNMYNKNYSFKWIYHLTLKVLRYFIIKLFDSPTRVIVSYT